MKIKIKNTILIISLLLILTSCFDNSIYFDINSQSVRSCNKKAFDRLYVISEDNKDFYYFTVRTGAEGTNNFNLRKPNRNYLLVERYSEINIDSFELKPEKGYLVKNITFGDAATGQILIKTDKRGRVVYSNVTNCQ
jgi:hypothetical protein